MLQYKNSKTNKCEKNAKNKFGQVVSKMKFNALIVDQSSLSQETLQMPNELISKWQKK